MKTSNYTVEQALLETITPEFPDVERTEESVKEFEEMVLDTYIDSLNIKQKRKIKNKEFKFSNQIKESLWRKKK